MVKYLLELRAGILLDMIEFEIMTEVIYNILHHGLIELYVSMRIISVHLFDLSHF